MSRRDLVDCLLLRALVSLNRAPTGIVADQVLTLRMESRSSRMRDIRYAIRVAPMPNAMTRSEVSVTVGVA